MINQACKLTIASVFPIFPPQSLSAERIIHLYQQVASQWPVEIISLSDTRDDYFTGIIAPGLSEIRIPKSIAHRQAEWEMEQKFGTQAADFSLLKLWDLTPEYLSALQQSAHDAIAIIFSHPYLFPAIKQIVSNKPICYEAIGIVSELSAPLQLENEVGIDLAQAIAKSEWQCCQESEVIITFAQNIAKQIQNRYPLSSAKIVCLPNGADDKDNQFISYQQRLINQVKLGLKSGLIAIFICSEYSDNIEEVKMVLNIASKVKQINFLILGNIGMSFNPRLVPPNVDFIPQLNLKIKSLLLNIADVALNLASKNTCNQAQIIEYFLKGIPIISTPESIAELFSSDHQYCLVGETWQFPELLLIAQYEDMADKESRIRRAREYIMEKFTWKQSAHQLIALLQDQGMIS